MPEFFKIPHTVPKDSIIHSVSGSQSKKEEISIGEEAPKEFVDVSFERSGKRRYGGSFVKREYQDEELALADAVKVAQLRSLGVPVPSTTRYFQENGHHALLITDLTEAGRNRVWSMNNSDQELLDLSLGLRDIKVITHQLQEIVRKAGEGGFTLNSDAFFIVKNKGDKAGRPRVVVGDFGMGVVKSDLSTDWNRAYNLASIKRLLNAINKTIQKEELPKAA